MFEMLDCRPEVVHPPLELLRRTVVVVTMLGLFVMLPFLLLHPPVDLVQQIAVPFELAANLVPFLLMAIGILEFMKVTFEFVDTAFDVVRLPFELFANFTMVPVPAALFFESLCLVLQSGGLIGPSGRFGSQAFDFDLSFLR
ncbi:hypothetical protein [Maioricimonas rarisocia]|uniref:hypothetical protein n=1 Tax=Maioricimonas rarisocia TaxID=2528026 RepID=UPI0018D252D2|nr:hypothetical protein [Maioricimonas rarisocia]